MKEFTVVKYKPEFYVDGIYTKKEWISRYDIGSIFDGKLFEMAEYQRVEDNYVNFIKDILAASGCNYFYVEYSELKPKWAYKRIKKDPFYKYDKKLVDCVYNVAKRRRFKVSYIDLVARLCLREYAYLILSNKSKHFSVRFGYDYYMYIGTNLSKSYLEAVALRYDLHVNPR
jgi:hypothetical protein